MSYQGSSGKTLQSKGASLTVFMIPFAGLEADSLLIIFTLAALPPRDQHAMLINAYKVSIVTPLLCCCAAFEGLLI